ncbi:MAG TPA: heparinase II/III family protein [Planctomycetota bacterium]|nr:heparinase II/III family protein [Planctomycetota bacterium]
MSQRGIIVVLLALLAGGGSSLSQESLRPSRHAIPKGHPRLFGSAEQILQLSRAKPGPWNAVLKAAESGSPPMALRARTRGFASLVTNDPKFARAAIADAQKIVAKGISTEHVEFEQRMWPVAETYDACFAWLTPEERTAFIDYLNKMFDANNVPGVDSYVAPWHNSHLRRLLSFGLTGYATYPENPRAAEIIEHVKKVEWSEKLLPALREYGAGGGWWEGRGYDTYSIFQFMTYADVARRVEGFDLFAQLPEYFEAKCAHEMFANYPGFEREYRARRAAISGDGKDAYGGFQEMVRAARFILAEAFHDKPAGQYLAAYNEATPQVTIQDYAVLDFLYKPQSPVTRPLAEFRTSHLESGPGTVFMRSSWDEDAVWARFQCGDHFTWHQHYEQNSFDIFHGGPLATNSGSFGSHDTNYYIRSVAHNTVLVHLPGEKWSQMRDGRAADSNDGGQAAKWDGVSTCPTVDAFRSQRAKWETGDLLAFGNLGTGATYVCGDATAAYSPQKLTRFVRHFVFLRPHTFVVLDIVQSKPGLKATWVLNSLNEATVSGDAAMIKVGAPQEQSGHLAVKCLLPEEPALRTIGNYQVDGKKYPPAADPRAGHARLEVESSAANGSHVFLFVLSTAPQAPSVHLERDGSLVGVDIEGTKVLLRTDGGAGGKVGGRSLPSRVTPLK